MTKDHASGTYTDILTTIGQGDAEGVLHFLVGVTGADPAAATDGRLRRPVGPEDPALTLELVRAALRRWLELTGAGRPPRA